MYFHYKIVIIYNTYANAINFYNNNICSVFYKVNAIFTNIFIVLGNILATVLSLGKC